MRRHGTHLQGMEALRWWPYESAVVTGSTCYTHCLMHAGVRAGHPH